MADLIGPFDTTSWSQAEWYQVAPLWASNGIVGTVQGAVSSGPFGVTATGLTVTLAALNQRAWIDGTGYKPDSNKTVTVTANGNASLSRRDRIVLRRDLSAKTLVPTLILGTASATPTPPALTQTSGGVYDIPVCSFLTPPNNGTTLTSFIDERIWIDAGSGDRTLGEGFYSGAGALTVAQTTAWTDIATVTATSTGRACTARWDITMANGNSGLNRTGNLRVICDSTVLGSIGPITLLLAEQPRIPKSGHYESTPGLGVHTWKLQANGSDPAAVVVEAGTLHVLEK